MSSPVHWGGCSTLYFVKLKYRLIRMGTTENTRISTRLGRIYKKPCAASFLRLIITHNPFYPGGGQARRACPPDFSFLPPGLPARRAPERPRRARRPVLRRQPMLSA